MTPKEMIVVLQAYADGQTIQSRSAGSEDPWSDRPTPSWNFVYNEYRVKPKRWRASTGERYYYITRKMTIDDYFESGEPIDQDLNDAGNYFKTYADALATLEKVKHLLDKQHETLGY